MFDSGLGGLIVAKVLIDAFPKYGFAYLGDTANLPYGNKSPEKIYDCSKECVDALFREHDAAIVIVACNTASIVALRRLQQEYLPGNFPDRRILGISIPTMEYTTERGYKNVGLIATNSTVKSGIYESELKKLDPDIKVTARATPLLVPLIEDGGDKYAPVVLADYLPPFLKCDALILGCSHYPRYKGLIREMLPGVDVISQDEIIPEKLREYFSRHPEIEGKLQAGENFFGITDVTENYIQSAEKLFGRRIAIEKASV